ncbi:hypothetical protein, partial [Citrobacter freundii]|uniref:hypothetical protein n=1 Tax=Citrobacter freundii TaxID=546 RepID=UPI0039C18F69
MNNNNTPRTPTLVESMLPILAMVLLLGVGYAAFDLPPEPLMVWIGPYISIHFLSLNPLLVRRRRYSRG